MEHSVEMPYAGLAFCPTVHDPDVRGVRQRTDHFRGCATSALALALPLWSNSAQPSVHGDIRPATRSFEGIEEWAFKARTRSTML